jgi:hypothetical protein
MKVFRLNSVIKRIRFTVAFYSDRLMPLKPSAAIASAISIAFFSLVYPRRLGWRTATCSMLCRTFARSNIPRGNHFPSLKLKASYLIKRAPEGGF